MLKVLHEKLMKREGGYAKLHQHPNHQIFLWLTLIVVVVVLTPVVIKKIDNSYSPSDVELALSLAQGEGDQNELTGYTEKNEILRLNTELLKLHGLLRASRGDKSGFKNQARDILERRAAKMLRLIKTAPSSVASVSFPKGILQELQQEIPEAVDLLESHGEWTGKAEVLIGDLLDGTKTSLITINTGGQILHVNLAFPEPAGLKCGSTLRVKGVRLSNNIAAAEGSISQSEIASATCSPTGEQNVVVILANFQSYQLTPGVDTEMIKGTLLGNAFSTRQNTPDWNVDGFWKDNSVNVTRVKNDGSLGSLIVVGPLNLNKNYNTNGSCDSIGIRNDATAAADSLVNYNNFNRILIVHPANGACSYAGQAYIGCVSQSTQDGTVTTGIAWQRSDQMTTRNNAVQLTTHEFGHSLGIHHASSRDFGSEAIGPLNTQGTLNEYGDSHSTMGTWNHGFYSAQHAAEFLNWMSQGSDYQIVENSGSYSLKAYETQSHQIKGLKIRRGAGNDAWLWLEFRTNTGLYDSTLNSQVWSGALIHYQDSFTGSYTHLVDFTTATSSFTDAALSAGQSWSDPYSNLTIAVNSIVGNTLNITVNYGTIPCVAVNPTVTITPDPATTSENVGANFNVSVKNNDTSTCSVRTFNLSSTLPSLPNWLTNFSATNLTLAPGATGSVTMTKTPPVGSIGSHTVNATAISGSNGSTDTATLNVTASLNITLATNKAVYKRGEKITMTATVLNGAPVSGVTVNFTLTKANGSIVNKTATTNASGVATWIFSSKRNDPTGTWTLNATAIYGSQSAVAPAKTFIVNP